MEQKTNEWYKERWGKFTASEFHKLMKSGRKKDQLFGETAMSYILSKLDEQISSHDMDRGGFQGNKSTDWGNMFESEAREKFQEKTGFNVVEVGFMPIADFLGGSPDGLIKRYAIIEIKCPFAPVNHTENMLLKDEFEFREAHEDYYVQMQVNMMAAGVDTGYFISYDPMKMQKAFQMKIIEVKRNQIVCDEIMMRYNEAMKIIYEKRKMLCDMLGW